VLNITSDSPAPGADVEIYERYQKWMLEVYAPLNLTIPAVLGADHYKIFKENREYPLMVYFSHYQNIKDWEARGISSVGSDIQKDAKSWEERGIVERIWWPAYALLRSFRSKLSPSVANETTMIDNASIMLLEAYRISAEEKDKYYKWFNDYGCNLFMPLIMKLPGLKGCDWYEYTKLHRIKEIRELNYPEYLSIIYFENLKAFDDFEKSPELVALQKSMRSVFPRGLNLQWHVQYELIKSFRK
jgi:hypothetical protein